VQRSPPSPPTARLKLVDDDQDGPHLSASSGLKRYKWQRHCHQVRTSFNGELSPRHPPRFDSRRGRSSLRVTMDLDSDRSPRRLMPPFNYFIARSPPPGDRLFMERRVCRYLFVERKLNSTVLPVQFSCRVTPLPSPAPRAVNSRVIVELRAARNAIPRNGSTSRAAPREAALVVAAGSFALALSLSVSLSLSLSLSSTLQARRFNRARACDGKSRNYARAASSSRSISIKRNSIDMDSGGQPRRGSDAVDGCIRYISVRYFARVNE